MGLSEIGYRPHMRGKAAQADIGREHALPSQDPVLVHARAVPSAARPSGCAG